MKLSLSLAAALLFAAPVYASDAQSAAEEFVNNPVQQQLLNDLLGADAILAQFQAMGLDLPQDKVDVLVGIVTEELAKIRPTMEAAMIEGAATAFSVEELEAMTAFYSTPLGASAMSKMTPYMQTTMGSLGPAMQQMQANIAQRVQAELQ